MSMLANLANDVFVQLRLAYRLVEYFALKGYTLDRNPGEVNIIYLEGANADGSPNNDAPDRWNDRRIVLMFDSQRQPFISLNIEATTEPGRSATMSQAAKKRGGVARIQIGQFQVWRVGFHNQAKNGKTHPALVQRGELWVHRDANQDGLRTGDTIRRASGINQHGTRPGYRGESVGTWSEGCLVARYFNDHLLFMDKVKQDPRYTADPAYLFRTTIIDATDLERAVPPLDPA
jgi:hypothetical protein